MKVQQLTPESQILKEMGQRLARLRKQQRISQTTLAEEAGIGVATLRRIEGGQDSQMESWLKILKALGMASNIDALLPEPVESPMKKALSEKRAQRRRKASESDNAAGTPWRAKDGGE